MAPRVTKAMLVKENEHLYSRIDKLYGEITKLDETIKLLKELSTAAASSTMLMAIQKTADMLGHATQALPTIERMKNKEAS